MTQQFLFLTTAFILGAVFLLRFGRDLQPHYQFFLSFPIGLVIWCLAVFILHVLGISDKTGLVFLFQGIIFIGCLFSLRRLKNRRIFRDLVLFTSIFIFLALIFLVFNFSFFSNDSWTQISHGRIIASSWNISDHFAASSGILSYIIQSAAVYYGFDYLYSIYPMLSFFFLCLLASCVFNPFEKKDFNLVGPAVLAGSAVLMTTGSFFFFFNSFYIHSNMMAGVYVFIAVFGLWKRITTGKKSWNAVAVPALVFFTLVRVEAPIFTLLFLVLLFSQEELILKEKSLYFGTVFLFLLLWNLRLAFMLRDYDLTRNKYHLTWERVLLVVGMYVFLFGFLLLLRWKVIDRIKRFFPFIMLYGLTAGWTFLLFYHGLKVKGGELILSRYTDLAVNIFREGGWGLLWAALIPLFVAAVFLRKIPGESPVLVFILAFFLLYQPLHLFRGGWREGWGDSGNRMLLHILPVVLFYVFLKFRLSFFKETLPEKQKKEVRP